MKYKDYKKIVMEKDGAMVRFTPNVWDYEEEYIDESKMSRETFDIRTLDDHINDYLMNGFAVTDQVQ